MGVSEFPIDEGTLGLADGRKLRWAMWGVSGGTPVLLFHGNPGSRLFRLAEEALTEQRALLVTIDRPGCGASSPRPGRRMVDWADDVACVADALGLDTFGVVGVSMGGPHSLACGAVMPERLRGMALHGSPGPWGESGFRDIAPQQVLEMRAAFVAGAAGAEVEYRRQFNAQRRAMLEEPDAALAAFVSRLAAPDQSLLQDPAARALARDDATEGIRVDSEGFFEERMAGYVLDWGFRLNEVEVAVQVFHGTEDLWIPAAVGRSLAERLPSAQLHELDGVGHFPPWGSHGALLRAAGAGKEAPLGTT